ncbi:hypothetical protein [Sphingomonas sp. DC2300-3]|uniref:hypothetical protein n=1 Tax=unclassified Sphingomonas TaxID=196159 RepID=UPI003CF30EB3
MDTGLTREILDRRIEDQMALAALATDDAVRAMHCDLASLYRSQLACLVTGDTLMATVAMLGLDLAA